MESDATPHVSEQFHLASSVVTFQTHVIGDLLEETFLLVWFQAQVRLVVVRRLRRRLWETWVW